MSTRRNESARPPLSTGVTERLDAMSITSEGQRRMATPIANGTNDRIESTTKPPKVSTPETFDGNQGRLEDFKLQVQLYFFFNRAQFATESEKVLYASSFLRGKAARGFRPYLKDWLDHQEGDQQPKTETRTIFHDYDQFEIKLEELYGIPNEESHADRHIRRLRQVTSVSSYASEFQGYAADLEWNDAALRSQFYLGLKEVVKAELSRGRTTRSLAAMMKEAKEIDERLQELRSDRMMYVDPGKGRTRTPREDPYGPRPMELDNLEKERKKSDKFRKIRCYRCQQQGHIARNCSQRQVSGEFNSMEKAAYQKCAEYLTTP